MHNIIIIPADKGGKVIVMNRDEYIQKIEEKLYDNEIYEEVQDPTDTIKKKITTLTNKLFKSNKISKVLKNEFSSVDDIPRLRGQLKVHKENCPMRLITSTKNTILAPISKYAFSYIQQLRETINHTISSTSKFINEISKIKTENNDNLVSLDIQDLFTNVPVMRAIDIAINRIGQSEKFCEYKLAKTDLKQILILSLSNNYCKFNEKYFRQKQGLPMGNTLSPILADLYTDEYIKNKIRNK